MLGQSSGRELLADDETDSVLVHAGQPFGADNVRLSQITRVSALSERQPESPKCRRLLGYLETRHRTGQ